MKLYNSLTKSKEEFKPIDKTEVKIYSCGPTVYNYAHIGNFRAYLFMDNLRRILKYNGYKLKHVMNITDVGHLVSDADTGEDKMIKASKREHKDPFEVAAFYTDAFFKDMDSLNIERPEIIPKATDNIKCMEEYVKGLIKNGYTYETENTIYFDTSKLENYGMLSNHDDIKKGARVEFDEGKKNSSDFALWIKAPKNHIMKWDSFWGECYPGWHLECSAMSRKYLGDEFDIHTGGVDHIPIHHENEIAQSMGLTGKIPARYWLHVNYMLVDGGKMSKSLGNTYTISDFKERGYDPLAFRMFMFSSTYRSKINFTWEAMDQASMSLQKLRSGYLMHKNGDCKVSKNVIQDLEKKFLDAINDDLNMPVAMSVVWDIIKRSEKSKDYAHLLEKFDEVLGFNLNTYKEDEDEIDLPDDIKDLASIRDDARKNKNWEESDRLRDIITSKGYKVIDTKEGTVIKK